MPFWFGIRQLVMVKMSNGIIIAMNLPGNNEYLMSFGGLLEERV